jgi:hypothetical protein
MVYDTTASWNGSSISAWGSVQSGATATYGQTFIAPTGDNVLQNFTFYVNGFGGQGTVTYQADVYAWSGSLVAGNSPQGSTGSPLFSLSNLTFTDNGSFQAVTINTGGVALTPGNAYVALFTTSDPTSITANSDSTGNFAFGANLFAHGSNNGGGGFNYYDNTSSSQLSAPSLG